MRILKYLFLLLLLSIVASTIFVATQKSDFFVERSKVINFQKSFLYSYVNDLDNWKDWNSLAVEDSLIDITLSGNTVGNGSALSWEAPESEGDIQTINAKESDSIYQKMIYNGNAADVVMRFKDTLGKTKVTWKARGKMGFLFKMLTTFNGGADKIFGAMFEKSLLNLDKKLDHEINTYTVKVNGVTSYPETFYLAQRFTSEFSKVRKNAGIVFYKITKFCDENTISISGKPFIIYHTYDTRKELTKLSICIPIKKPIFISEGSDIISDTLKPFQAIKSTLTGDYSHSRKAWDKTVTYLRSKYITPDKRFSHIEVYAIGKKELNNPSKWVTEIYAPTKQKVAATTTEISPKTPEKIIQKTPAEKEIPSEF